MGANSLAVAGSMAPGAKAEAAPREAATRARVFDIGEMLRVSISSPPQVCSRQTVFAILPFAGSEHWSDVSRRVVGVERGGNGCCSRP